MYLMRNHDVWIYVRCANSDPRIAFDRLYDLIDEAAGHGFLVRGTSFDHCSGNTLKDRIGLRSMLDAVENGRIEAVIVRDLEQISRNSYILVGVIEILRQNDVYLITTECDLNAELINSGRTACRCHARSRQARLHHRQLLHGAKVRYRILATCPVRHAHRCATGSCQRRHGAEP